MGLGPEGMLQTQSQEAQAGKTLIEPLPIFPAGRTGEAQADVAGTGGGRGESPGGKKARGKTSLILGVSAEVSV